MIPVISLRLNRCVNLATSDAAGEFPDRGMPSYERDTRSGDIPRVHLAENPYGSRLSHGFEFATSPQG
jgi:hypothetical protein